MCCECFEQLQKRSVIGCFHFLIQLLIRMKFYIKSHVRLYKILCSVAFFLISISFIRCKVTIMVLICFVFPSWMSFWIGLNRYIISNHSGREWYLAFVDMVVRMDRSFASHLAIHHFNSSVANNFIHIHIWLCSWSSLPNNQWKMILQFPRNNLEKK